MPCTDSKQYTGSRLAIMLLFLLYAWNGTAQHTLISYLHGDIPGFNPAFQHNNTYNEVAVFPASSFGFSFISPFSQQGITSKTAQGQRFIDLSKMVAKSGKDALFQMDMAVDYFQYRNQIGKHFWQISLSENVHAAIRPEKKLFTLLNKGNVQFMNEWFETQLPVGFIQYATLASSTSRQLNDQIKIGFSGKIYWGKAYLQAAPIFRLFTAQEADYLTTAVEGQVKASLPFSRNINPDGNVNGWSLQENFSVMNYLFQWKNPGLGLDFGIDYQLNEQWSWSAAILDLGFISWNTNRNSLNLSGKYRWDGADISEMLASKFIEQQPGQGISLADSFIFSNIHPVDRAFVSILPARLNLGIQYNWSENITFNMVQQWHYFNKLWSIQTLLALKLQLNEQVQICTGISHVSKGIPAVPLSMAFTFKQLKIVAGLHNTWGTILPRYNKHFGGSFSLSYRMNYRTLLPSSKSYPFYQPQQAQGKSKK